MKVLLRSVSSSTFGSAQQAVRPASVGGTYWRTALHDPWRTAPGRAARALVQLPRVAQAHTASPVSKQCRSSAAADDSMTATALVLLNSHSHSAAPTNTHPLSEPQPNAHVAGKAQERLWQAQSDLALSSHDCANCNVRAGSRKARAHRRSAPVDLPDHIASLRCGERNIAALLLSWRAQPPTAEFRQQRWCFSELRVTLLMRLRTRGRQQGVS